MQRYDIINTLIKKYNYTSYLEIGVQQKKNWGQIICENKIGVDPDPSVQTTYNLTSDDFFRLRKEFTFDLVFIDGLHESEQVYRDIINSLDILNEGGTIVCHDMLPIDEKSQLVPRQTKCWMGDVWKSFVKLRYERDDLEMYTVDTDCGCGIIKRGKQEKIDRLIEDYKDFDKNRYKAMNIVTVDQFLAKL
jgi:hypothetical protein